MSKQGEFNGRGGDGDLRKLLAELLGLPPEEQGTLFLRVPRRVRPVVADLAVQDRSTVSALVASLVLAEAKRRGLDPRDRRYDRPARRA